MYYTLAYWSKFIDADDFHLKICSADTIFTYFQDRIGMTHYLFFVADNDAGKSANLSIFNILGYRNLMSTSMTYANVYNFLGNKDEGIGTICYDEADTLDNNHDIMGIFKEGYTTGYPVVRMVDTAYGKKQLKMNTFCFKAFAGERLPDAVTARGFLQRIIEIRCLPGYPEFDISEVVNPAGDDEFEGLRNELNDLRNTLFCYRLLHFKDKIPNIKLNIRNREKQLFKPVLRIFQGTRTFETLKPVISSYIRERRRTKVNSYHAFLYRIVRDLIASQGTHELQSSNIWDFIKLNLQWKVLPYSSLSIETVEFGIISQKDVISTLKEIMKAEPGRSNSARTLVFSQDVMDRMKDNYELDIEIQVDVTDVTHVTDSGGIDNGFNQNYDAGNGENTENINKNYREEDTKYNDDKRNSTNEHSQNASQASHVSLDSYKCPFCEILYHNNSKTYDNEEALKTHAVNEHQGRNIFHQPDIERFRQQYLSKNCNSNGKECKN